MLLSPVSPPPLNGQFKKAFWMKKAEMEQIFTVLFRRGKGKTIIW